MSKPMHRILIAYTAIVAAILLANATSAASSALILPPLAELGQLAVDVVVVGEGFGAKSRREIASMVADSCQHVLEDEGLLVTEDAEATLYLLVRSTGSRDGSSALLVRGWLKEPALLERPILGEAYKADAVLWELEKLELIPTTELEDRAVSFGKTLARELALEIHQAAKEYGAHPN